jgi:hypothetical protein
MSKPSTDIIRRVFEEGGRCFIEVGPWPDDPSIVELRTVKGKHSAGYWGAVNIALNPDMAAELGRPLIAAAVDCGHAA